MKRGKIYDQTNVVSVVQCVHSLTGMIGMYNVASVQGMPGLRAAADSCHLLCQKPTTTPRAFNSLSLTLTRSST